MRRVVVPLMLLISVVAIACGARRSGPAAPRRDRTVLTREQILERNYTNAYDAIEALRSNWLRTRGTDSFNSPTQIWVYYDGTRMGALETLRNVQPRMVQSIRFMDGLQATARWGVGHSAGVIHVLSWPTAAESRAARRDSTRADSAADGTGGAPRSGTDSARTPTPARPVPPPTVTRRASGGEVERALAPGDGDAYVVTVPGAGRFALAAGGRAATVLVDPRDHAGVLRVVRDLRADVGRVTGTEPRVVVDSTAAAPAGARELVIVGTLGRSPLVDRLVREGKVDARGVAGKWETFLLQVVERPLPGVERALVIAGSDKRGTIYGVYDLSAQIGVSPWHWFADVPARRQAALYVLPGRHTLGEPAVRYRGIFINDEAPAFAGWTREKFGGVNSKAYAHVFELILRMKGNYLWPAMWGNAFADDDSLTAPLADEYGIVMGTSHHEPLTRAQAEWRRYGKGPWDYEKNDSTLRAFWRGGIERMGTRENVVTVGMRGDGDEPMTEGTAIALLERIVADQRKLIADVTRKPAAETPQLWALYKEVQDYYDKGMRVPDDVTLLFADDNWGNIRRLPGAKDRGRAGGFGVYYHFDYVGGPRNYKWLNTNPIGRVWEQMRLAHESGANRIWIVNVGDIKPMEFPIQFFLDYAWNPDRWPAERLPEYTRRWAAQTFGEAHAPAIADVVSRTLQLAGRRKPELLDTATYSLTNFREAETVLAEYAALRRDAERLSALQPAAARDAFYQLVLHPVLALSTFTELQVTVARNRLYATQGRAATNDLADSARRLFARDAEITRFYNDTLAGGKWSHMMDQTHIGYTYWQEPPRNVMPRVDVIQLPTAAEMGVAVVEQNRPAPPRRAGPGGPPPGAFGPPQLALPTFDPYQQQTYHLDVYNRGRTAFAFAASADQPWVVVTPARGTVDREQRLAVRVDWSRAPAGTSRVPITVTGPGGSRAVVQAVVQNPESPRREAVTGFVQGNGYVSMEAEHYTRAVDGSGVRWQRVPYLGRTLSGMTPSPAVSPARTPGGSSPRLEYRMTLFDSGEVKVHAYLSPTHNVAGGQGLRYAVSIDDEAPQIVNLHADGWSGSRTDGNRAWEQAVADNVKILTSTHRVARPGVHVLKFWMVDPAVVLQKLVVAGGELPQSYLGPPESFHAARAADAATAPRDGSARRGERR
jgi:hypothetical protein